MKTIKTTQVDLLFRLVAWNSHRLVALDPHRISFALAKKWVIFSGNGSGHLQFFGVKIPVAVTDFVAS